MKIVLPLKAKKRSVNYKIKLKKSQKALECLYEY